MEELKTSEEANGMEDLKGLVIEALNKNAVLDSIRSQLRSTVFSAIQSQQEGPQTKGLDTPQAEAALALLTDFLTHTDMQDTLKVLKPECPQIKSQPSLLKNIGLSASSEPMIYSLIQAYKSLSPEELIRESIEEDIDYEDDFEFSSSQQKASATIGESGGSSMGVDASVDSMALEEFDYHENVKRQKK